jgi:hypothetical protein
VHARRRAHQFVAREFAQRRVLGQEHSLLARVHIDELCQVVPLVQAQLLGGAEREAHVLRLVVRLVRLQGRRQEAKSAAELAKGAEESHAWAEGFSPGGLSLTSNGTSAASESWLTWAFRRLKLSPNMAAKGAEAVNGARAMR